MPMLSHADNTEDPAPQSQPQAAAPNSPPPSALRAQRLSADEARAVIDLWQAELVEQTGLTDRPAVPDVAEGLELSVEDVQRLLAEVRTRRDAEARLLAHEQELAEIRLAEEQRKLAEEQRKLAEEQRKLAEEQRKLAEIQRQRAELARQQAEAERRGADPWRQLESHAVPPRRLLGKLPQGDTQGWQGAAAFSPEDEAVELLAEQRAQAERIRKANIAFLQFIAFVVLVPLCVYLWALLVQP